MSRRSKWFKKLILIGLALAVGAGWIFFSADDKETELPTEIVRNWPVYAGTFFSPEPLIPDVVSPKVSHIDIPDFPGAFAIWGGIGRAEDGRIWFSAASHSIDKQSGRLFVYDPELGTVASHGDILSELCRSGVYREGEQQPKIHTKILQGTDGYLYFASTDDPPKNATTERAPLWGSHLWRYRPEVKGWQHLQAFDEGFIALAGNGIFFYGLLYPDHHLIQYDSRSGKIQRTHIGSVEGHVSRHLLCDFRGHVYVPRLRMVRSNHAEHTLVELDTNLREVAEFPLPYYQNGAAVDCHGILAYQALPDHSICFTTHAGRLFRVIVPKKGPSELQDLGWFHSQGKSYASGLFTFSGETYLMGLAEVSGHWDWVCYDLKKRKGTEMPINFPQDTSRLPGEPLLYGCSTQDSQGGFYMGGCMRNPQNQRVPVLLRIAGMEFEKGSAK